MTMFRLNHAIAICTLAVTPLFTVEAHAETYYVATTGSDSNPGTENKPWRTIAHAVTTMIAGDTTYVKDGAYDEAEIRFRRSGTQSAQIRLLNAPGESPVIQCIHPNPPLFHRVLIQHSSGIAHAMGWITIEGFEIRNCWDGIKMYSGHNITIRRNWIHNNTSQGILGTGTRILVDRNIINHNGPFVTNPTANGSHGIYVNGTAWTITNNLIYDNLGYGIQMNGSSSSLYNPTKHAGHEFAVAESWVVANNTFAYQKNRSGIVVWGSTCNNARIENNIFYENAVALDPGSPQGITFVSTACTGLQIRNNLFYATAPGGTIALGLGATENVHYAQSGNIINVSPPGFVNAPATLPALPNFSLTERSPAIDKGSSLAATRTSFDGTPRPQGHTYDIGAYEYSPDADAQSPSAPGALQIN